MNVSPKKQCSPAPPPAFNGSFALSYVFEKFLGHGSFGVVYLAKEIGSGELVAIKRLLQDPRFHNREIQILRSFNHPNLIRLVKSCFYDMGSTPDEMYLNLVMEYVPDNLYHFLQTFIHKKQYLPLIYVKLFSFQLCRALAHLHSPRLNICYRDLKPQNVLVDPRTGVLKLCDFGSAKWLVPGEKNIAYICSRYYRAPELLFASQEYTNAIDLWSLGVVIAEMLIGQPMFPGETTVDQVVEIVKVLGAPSEEEIYAMNPNREPIAFPKINTLPWNKLFPEHVPAIAKSFVKSFLVYEPQKRASALSVMAHPFFDELRDPSTRLPNGAPLPPLFNFTTDELEYIPSSLLERILPKEDINLNPVVISMPEWLIFFRCAATVLRDSISATIRTSTPNATYHFQTTQAGEHKVTISALSFFFIILAMCVFILLFIIACACWVRVGMRLRKIECGGAACRSRSRGASLSALQLTPIPRQSISETYSGGNAMRIEENSSTESKASGTLGDHQWAGSNPCNFRDSVSLVPLPVDDHMNNPFDRVSMQSAELSQQRPGGAGDDINSTAVYIPPPAPGRFIASERMKRLSSTSQTSASVAQRAPLRETSLNVRVKFDASPEMGGAQMRASPGRDGEGAMPIRFDNEMGSFSQLPSPANGADSGGSGHSIPVLGGYVTSGSGEKMKSNWKETSVEGANVRFDAAEEGAAGGFLYKDIGHREQLAKEFYVDSDLTDKNHNLPQFK